MRIWTVLALGAAGWLGTAGAASAEVQLTIQDGRVSLVAKDATLRQILHEWAKVGHTTIVNVDRVPGGPMTLQLTDVPEEQALDTLLRPLSGYVAAPRATEVSTFSRYDRILVMPTMAPASTAGSAPAASVSPPPPPAPFTQFNNAGQPQPHLQAMHPNGSETDEEDRLESAQRAPVYNPNPTPQPAVGQTHSTVMTTPGVVPVPPPGQSPQQYVPVVPPQQPNGTQGPAATYPGGTTAPGGVSVPGMIVPALQQPGQPAPGQPFPPPQPRRPQGIP